MGVKSSVVPSVGGGGVNDACVTGGGGSTVGGPGGGGGGGAPPLCKVPSLMPVQTPALQSGTQPGYCGVDVGVVRRMLTLPSCEVLEVRRAVGEGELLVPLVKDAIRRVSVGERLIEIDASFLEQPTAERPPRRRKAGDRRMGAGGRGD